MQKQLQPWQGARLDFEATQCVYVCTPREEDGEVHLKCTVEAAVKQSQAFAESRNQPGTPHPEPPRTSPEPAPELPVTSGNHAGTHTSSRTGTSRNQPRTGTGSCTEPSSGSLGCAKPFSGIEPSPVGEDTSTPSNRDDNDI